MGIKLFRNDNWDRIRNGDISRRDIMNLDGDKDRELIRKLGSSGAGRVGRELVHMCG